MAPSNTEEFSRLDADSSLADLVEHPAFKGFGARLLPGAYNVSDGAIPLHRVDSILPHHRHVDAAAVLGALNHMIGEAGRGGTIFYDFHTEEQKRETQDKASTGLFFFRGKPGAPFAVICPGGSFRYVASLHEGFPLAVELSKKGYNAFVLKYRVACAQALKASGFLACEDLAAALSYIFRNAEELAVARHDYSLWGASAGGWMADSTAARGTAHFGGDDLPAPCALVMMYPVLTGFCGNVPPTFFAVSATDEIITALVEQRVKDMLEAGIDAACREYLAGHGFGLGTGTDAEGWLEHAVRFWRKHMGEHMKKRKGRAMAFLRQAVERGRVWKHFAK